MWWSVEHRPITVWLSRMTLWHWPPAGFQEPLAAEGHCFYFLRKQSISEVNVWITGWCKAVEPQWRGTVFKASDNLCLPSMWCVYRCVYVCVFLYEVGFLCVWSLRRKQDLKEWEVLPALPFSWTVAHKPHNCTNKHAHIKHIYSSVPVSTTNFLHWHTHVCYMW